MSYFKSILVADHLGKLDRFACQVLGHDKWALSLADNLADVEDCVRQGTQHVILLNADIPGLELNRFMSFLQSNYGESRPRVILCISQNVSRTLKKGCKAGVDDLLTVPFHGSELAAKVIKQLQYFNSSDNASQEIARLKDLLAKEQLNSQNLNQKVKAEKKQKESMRIEMRNQVRAVQKKKTKAPKANPADAVVMPFVPPAPNRPFLKAVPTTPKPPKSAGLKSMQRDWVRPNTDSQSKTTNSKVILMALRIKGLRELIEEVDGHTSSELMQFLFANISRVVERNHGEVVHLSEDTIVATFQKSRTCSTPGAHAACAAIELEEQSIFLSEYDALLSGIEYSIVIHSGVLSIFSSTSESKALPFIFGNSLQEILELMDSCPRSRIIISDAVFDAYRDSIQIGHEMHHNLLCTGKALNIAEVFGCQIPEKIGQPSQQKLGKLA